MWELVGRLEMGLLCLSPAHASIARELRRRRLRRGCRGGHVVRVCSDAVRRCVPAPSSSKGPRESLAETINEGEPGCEYEGKGSTAMIASRCDQVPCLPMPQAHSYIDQCYVPHKGRARLQCRIRAASS